MIRIATVDDHPIFLEGLQRILKRMGTVEVVAQGTCADEAIQIAREARPDVMLLDIAMPGGGLHAAAHILAEEPKSKIILLTASDEEEQLSDAIALGVKGYVLKAGAVNELQSAIASVESGGTYVSVDFAARVVMAMARKPPRHRIDKADFTPSERRILDLLILGLSNKQIAEQLTLAVPTVKNALSASFSKLKVRTRLQALIAWRKA